MIKKFKHSKNFLSVDGKKVYLEFLESPDLHALFSTYKSHKSKAIQTEVDLIDAIVHNSTQEKTQSQRQKIASKLFKDGAYGEISHNDAMYTSSRIQRLKEYIMDD